MKQTKKQPHAERDAAPSGKEFLMQLYYIRHGEPIYEPDQLTEKGHAQARALGEAMKDYGIDKIFASTSNRARQTAQPLADALQKDVVLLDWCNEKYAADAFGAKDDGKWSWIYRVEKYLALFASDEVYALRDKWYEHPAFAALKCKEGYLRAAREADAFLESFGLVRDENEHCYRADKLFDGKIALFAHEGFGHFFLPYVTFIPYPLFARFDNAHTGVTQIDFKPFEDGRVFPRIQYVSNTAHLR